ncbi:MAG: DNA-3-methyladenine glycosylase I, partial [Pseudomonadota bacterium]|nr:DNA-3-methyladenine glycosylase I [Pseudomonadota bacterium]
NNAQRYLKILEKEGSFSDYIWQFVEGKPIINNWTNEQKVPAKSIISDQMAKKLKKDGFNFVGSTICYAFMQAVGMVNDHSEGCFKHKVRKK